MRFNRLERFPFCKKVVAIEEMNDGEENGFSWYYVTRGRTKQNRCECRVFMESEKFRTDAPAAEKDKAKADLIAKWNTRLGKSA